MTDNEIIKALEEIEEKYGCFDVDQTPLVYMRTENAKAILDLINRQKTEIDILIRKKDRLEDEIAEQKAEIEKLKKSYEIYEESSGLKWAKAEAIKEFAERLREKSIFLEDEERYFGYAVKVEDIDDTLKELTEKGGVQE